MSLLAQAQLDTLSPEEMWATNADTPSSFAEYMGLSYGQGVEGSIRGWATAVGPDYQPPMSGGIFGQPAVQQPSGTPRLTEDEWKASKNYRPEIPYDPGMTEARAEFLKQQFDSRRWRDDVYRRYQGGLAGQAAGIAAMLAGGSLSPENFIPILGPASRAYMAARLGRVGGLAAVGAAEGAIGNLAVAPYVYQGLASQGEDVGLEDVALDVAFGAVLGGAFGAGAGALGRARAMREAAVSGRGASVHRLTDGLNLAADAVERGDVPDVAWVVAPEVERARAVTAAMPELPPLRPPSRAFTASGRAVPVQYEVVDAATLVTSHDGDLNVNPAFPAEMQPRNRERAASAQQIAELAARLEPERLGYSAEASGGAPIIGPDNVVESGNGRMLAIRRAYAQGGDRAAAYRAYVEGQGFDTKGMTEPVLVRRRQGDMAPEERAQFAREANKEGVASMSASEQAMADAASLTNDITGLVRSADIHAASNRQFVRSFFGKAVAQSEHGAMMTADGQLSLAGARRINDALLARAYGNGDLVARLAEASDSELGSVGSALRDVAPLWAKMRVDAAEGRIDAGADGTVPLMEAVRSIVVSRQNDTPLHFALSQDDMFGDALSADGRAFLHSMLAFDKKGDSRLKGRATLAEQLRAYIDAAEREGPSMFAAGPVTPRRILGDLGQVPPEMALGPILDPRPLDPDPEPPSVTEAAARVGKDTPELQQFVEDMGLEDSSVVDMDLNELRRAGTLTAEDEAALQAAADDVKMAESVALSYETLSTCVLRYGT